MQKKSYIICFVIIMISTISITSQIVADDYNKENNNITLFNRYIIFGLMSQINEPYSELLDFEINRFALIFGDNEIQKLNQGEMIRLHGTTFGVITNNIFIGLISDWSIIG